MVTQSSQYHAHRPWLISNVPIKPYKTVDSQEQIDNCLVCAEPECWNCLDPKTLRKGSQQHNRHPKALHRSMV